MAEFIKQLTSIPIHYFVIGGGFVFAFFITVIVLVYSYHQNRSNNELKMKMLEQGMSAEDIERVMNSGKNDWDIVVAWPSLWGNGLNGFFMLHEKAELFGSAAFYVQVIWV